MYGAGKTVELVLRNAPEYVIMQDNRKGGLFHFGETNGYGQARPTIWDGATILFIAAAALILSIVLYGRTGETVLTAHTETVLTAVVYADGTETDRVPLDNLQSQKRIYHSNGYTLEVTFCPDGETAVEVSASGCPGRDCMHMGRIHIKGQCIVCLPSRIVIQLEQSAQNPEGGTQNEDVPDMVLR